MMSTFTVPQDLIKSIKEGRCIAFVGAGFSQPTIPGWVGLLEQLVEKVPDANRCQDLKGWLQAARSSRDYEGIAEAVTNGLGDAFGSALQGVLEREVGSENQRRISLLREIPFHYVLTTNFDHLLGEPKTAGPDTFAGALAAPRRPWWHEDFWPYAADTTSYWKNRLIAVHGEMKQPESLVFSTSRYRRHLFGDPAYRGFLRTLFASHNVLYLGFSFTDAYVNLLRSEIMSMTGWARALDN